MFSKKMFNISKGIMLAITEISKQEQHQTDALNLAF
jgi:hypothetical protein